MVIVLSFRRSERTESWGLGCIHVPSDAQNELRSRIIDIVDYTTPSAGATSTKSRHITNSGLESCSSLSGLDQTTLSELGPLSRKPPGPLHDAAIHGYGHGSAGYIPWSWNLLKARSEMQKITCRVERSTVRLGQRNPLTAVCIHSLGRSGVDAPAAPMRLLTARGRSERVYYLGCCPTTRWTRGLGRTSLRLSRLSSAGWHPAATRMLHDRQ